MCDVWAFSLFVFFQATAENPLAARVNINQQLFSNQNASKHLWSKRRCHAQIVAIGFLLFPVFNRFQEQLFDHK